MNLAQTLYTLQKEQSNGHFADRIVSELTYLYNISQTKNGAYDAQLAQVCDKLLARVNETGGISRDDMLSAEAELASLVPAAKGYTAYCVSHAHIDMNWKWGFQETASVTIETFRTMLNLMKEYPAFKFSQSQASVYRIVEEYAPEMLDEIKQRVHEGRWEVAASTWTECDKNMPSGESLARQTLYTKRYLAELLDIDPKTLRLDFEPDTFGHNVNIPEILQNAGVDYYYHCRGCDYRYLYNWRAPSGKEILVYQEPKWYLGAIEAKLYVDYPLFCAKVCEGGVPFFLSVYGVGDHGGGPTRRDIERLMEMDKWPLFPHFVFSTYADFFAALEQYRDKLPTYEGELNFIFNGCYTTQARIKMANRLGEARLYDAEQLNSAAQLLCGAKGAEKAFAGAWEKVLFSQFHDILPGSCVIESREYCLGQFQQTLATANTQANAALHIIADQIDTSAIAFDRDIAETTSEGGGAGYRIDAAHSYQLSPAERGRGKVRVYHLFNTTQYDRTECVELSLFDYAYDTDNVEIVNAVTGEPAVWKNLELNRNYYGHRLNRILVQVSVPAFGYATYILRQREDFDSRRIGFDLHPGPRQDHLGDMPMVLENEKIKVVLDPYTCAVASFVDKESGRELIDSGRPAGVVRFIRENPRYGMTSWRVGQYMQCINLNEVCDVKITDYRCDRLLSSASYEIKYANSKVKVTINLPAGSSVLNFTLNVDWHEIGSQDTCIPQLNFYVPVGYACTRYRYDVPYGTLIREALAHDVPANSYIEMLDGENEASRHLMLVTDTKYGYRGNEGAGAVTLLRSAFGPDPLPESGNYTIQLGLAVCDTAESAREITTCFNHTIAYTCGLNHTGSLGLDGRMFTLDGAEEIAVGAVKPAEDGGIVIRLKSCCDRAQTVGLTFAKAPAEVCLTDITEEARTPLAVEGSRVSVPVDAQSLATLWIRLK